MPLERFRLGPVAGPDLWRKTYVSVDLGLKPLCSASKRWGLPSNRREEMVPVLFPLNKRFLLFLVFLYSICGSVNIRLFLKLLKSVLL